MAPNLLPGGHQSLFTYNLQRNYPFRWFTPVTIIGGIAAAVLFSVLNLATTGYILQTVYTTEPNATLHQDYWFNKAPWSWTAKLSPSCQAQDIPIGYEFFTKNFGFSYTLDSVSRFDEALNATSNYPSLPYLNQKIDNCAITSIEIALAKNDMSEAGQSSWWSWPGTGKVTATCTISTGAGMYNATFWTECGRSQRDYSYVIQTNYTSFSSMWWATRLLNLEWNALAIAMTQALYPYNSTSWTTTPIWMTYHMTLTPNKTEDITTADFFSLAFYIIASNANLYNQVVYPLNGKMYNNGDGLPWSISLTEGLEWAKVAYSSILMDLGQSHGQNLLLSEEMLQWALHHPGDSFRSDPKNVLNCSNPNCNYYWSFWNGLAPPGADPDAPDDKQVLIHDAYDTFKSKMGPLGTVDTTIFTQYACSVPVRKSGGTLFISVLVADLVFLQAAWKILTMIATMIVAKKTKSSMYCEGCNKPYELISSYDHTRSASGPEIRSESTQTLVNRRSVPSATASLFPQHSSYDPIAS